MRLLGRPCESFLLGDLLKDVTSGAGILRDRNLLLIQCLVLAVIDDDLLNLLLATNHNSFLV